MELVSLVIVVLGMGVVLAVGKRVCIVVAMRVFGWKPKILDEQQVEITVKECTAEFFQQCKNLRPEQVACMSDDDKRMMLEDMELYTRRVIESYVQNYLLAN